MGEELTGYWVNRINKISLQTLRDPILRNTWLYDRSLTRYKPFDNEDDFTNLLNLYFKSNYSDKKLKEEIFEKSMWYAAYLAYYTNKKYKKCNNVSEPYSFYFTFAAERLWDCIDMYNPNLGCSLYTYVFNDYNYRIKREVDTFTADDNLNSGSRSRLEIALNKFKAEGKRISEARTINPEEFYEKYNISKDTFFKMLSAMHVESLNVSCKTVLEDDPDAEFVDLLEDNRYRFENDIMYKNMLEEVTSTIKQLYPNNDKFYNIWMDIMFDDEATLYTLSDKYGLSREGVRQIFIRINDKLSKCENIRAYRN